MNIEREHLEHAIAALERQRGALGDAVVDAAVSVLRERCAGAGAAPHTAEVRRHATVLLADVSGFTAMSEQLDAEVVTDTMNAVWTRIDAVIVEHGGLIDKHIGDAVLALWGAEAVREDDPARAVRAALHMQTVLASMRDARGAPLAMRIGIGTGPVHIGEVATTGEFSVIGAAANLASRLEELAEPGEVLIASDTYVHVRGCFDVRARPPQRLRGITGQRNTYVVVGPSAPARRGAPRGVEGVATRMVGRDEELRVLDRALTEVIETARPRLVTITGEAGIGKSRLLREFIASLAHRAADVQVIEASASAESQQVSFGLMRDLFARRFGILESDRPSVVIEKFRAGMDGVLKAEDADVVGHMVGFDLSASGAVQNLLGSPSFGRLAMARLNDYFRAVARRATVLVLEDVHWADDSSLDLIAALASRSAGTRLLAVCLARPALFDRRPDWFTVGAGGAAASAPPSGTGRDDLVMRLTPLQEAHARALVGEILKKADAVPGPLADLLVQTAEGIPFYAEELVKVLIEDAVIRPGAERWDIDPCWSTTIRVPATLSGVLQARLDALPPCERLVLQLASIVGRVFWAAAVADLVGEELGTADLAAALSSLARRELIFVRDASTVAGTDEYVFKHALLRDVTYDTVLLKSRQAHHARVARWLESNGGQRIEEILGLIAGHCERAGELQRAADFLRRAGEERHGVSAYRDALAAFDRALALLPDEPSRTRASLLVARGHSLRFMGDYAGAMPSFADGIAAARTVGDTACEISGLNGLGMTVRVQGDLRTAAETLAKALALAEAAGDRRGMAASLYNLGDTAFRRGDADEAERYARLSLDACRALEDRQGMAFAHRVLGFAALLRGEHSEAERCHERSRSLYDEIGDRWGVAACCINLGETARRRGDFGAAVTRYEEALAIAEETGARYEIAICHNNLGHAHLGFGDRRAARPYLRTAIDEALAVGVVPIVLEALVGFATLLSRAGRRDEGAALLGYVFAHPALNEENASYARPLETDLIAALGSDRYDAARARGAAMTLEQVLALVDAAD